MPEGLLKSDCYRKFQKFPGRKLFRESFSSEITVFRSVNLLKQGWDKNISWDFAEIPQDNYSVKLVWITILASDKVFLSDIFLR